MVVSFFVFKQKTAYDLRISDWSSDVCSSDLPLPPSPLAVPAPVGEPTNREMVQAVRDWIESAIKPKAEGHAKFEAVVAMNALGIVMRDLDAGVRAEDRALAAALLTGETTLAEPGPIGRAACRGRGCQDVEISVVAGTLKKKNRMTQNK